MDGHYILGVHIADRTANAIDVQKTLTQYGCNIRTRVGLHHVDDKVCSSDGLILLELFGDRQACDDLADKLSRLGGIEVQRMIFEHPRGRS